MALLWTDDSEFTATTRTLFRGSHGACSVKWRTELLDRHTCLRSIRPTVLRDARSVQQYQYGIVRVSLDHLLMGNPDFDDRPVPTAFSGRSCCLTLPEKPCSPSFTRVTTHRMAGPFLGATPTISKASPRPSDIQHPTPYRICSSDPGRPETSHQPNYKTITRTRHTARHERLRTFTDAPRG